MTSDSGQALVAVDEEGTPVPARTPDLRRLLAYWDEKRGARRFPGRADIDPIDLRFMLDRIALIEVHDQGRRFKLRVVGSWWSRKFGFEPTGIWLEDWPNPEQMQLTLKSYEKLLVLRRPVLLHRDEWVEGTMLSYEAILLPLSDDDDRISMIVAGNGGG